MAEPDLPDAETREHLLDVLAELVAKGGSGPLLLPPVEPGEAAFPDPWAPTRTGVAVLLRRLAWHAGMACEIEIEDRLAGPPPTERKPATRVELLEVRNRTGVFVLTYVGDDAVAGTLAHEIGLLHAVLHRPDEQIPYRTAKPPVIAIEPERDLERGSIATIYLGLGVLAANAARQQHTVFERQVQGILAPVAIVVEAGHVPVTSLGYLLAVQAIVRGDKQAPRGLVPAQRREVEAWMGALRGRADELRARLGIASDAEAGERPEVVPFPDVVLDDEPPQRAIAFRWHTNRGGVGLIAGALLGAGFAAALASRTFAPIALIGVTVAGHVIGRRVRVPRCSGCATVCASDATGCRKCGAALRGDIASLSERLEAEERLERAGSGPST